MRTKHVLRRSTARGLSARSPLGFPNPTEFELAHDTVPNFAYNPDRYSVASGDWSSGSTWSGGVVPQAGERVVINTAHAVTYDVDLAGHVELEAVTAFGDLVTDPAVDAYMKVGTLQVAPGGGLDVQPQSDKTHTFVWSDVAIDDADDPGQYQKGLVVLGGLYVRGAPKTRKVQVTGAPGVGTTSVTLATSPSGWAAGDTLMFPPCGVVTNGVGSFDVPKPETPVVDSVAGTALVVGSALTQEHRPGYDADGTTVQDVMRPWIANTTCNVVFRSESASTYLRGHGFFSGAAEIDVEHAMFKDMGRTLPDEVRPPTDPIGRYSVHFHHLDDSVTVAGGAYRARMVGCVVEGGLRWGVAVHGCHWGLFQNNVVWDVNQWAFTTERGDETGWLVDNNFFAYSNWVDPEFSEGLFNRAVNVWLESTRFTFTNNVCTGSATAVWIQPNLNASLQFTTPVAADSATTETWYWIDSNVGRTLEGAGRDERVSWPFENNTIYACGHGVWFDHRQGENVIDGLYVHGQWGGGDGTWGFITGYYDAGPSGKNILRNAVGRNAGIDNASTAFTVVEGADIQTTAAGAQGIRMANGTKSFAVRDSTFIAHVGAWLLNGQSAGDLPPGSTPPDPLKTVVLRNCLFTAPPSASLTFVDFQFDDFGGFPGRVPCAVNDWYVLDHQQSYGTGYRLYQNAQLGTYSPVPWEDDLEVVHPGVLVYGSPAEGLDNDTCWATYGRAICGKVAPGTAASLTGLTDGVAQSLTVDRVDRFTRADDASSLGTPTDSGSAWVAGAGTWGISGNRAYRPSGPGESWAYLAGTLADCQVEVKVAVASGGAGLIARRSGNSYLLWRWASDVLAIGLYEYDDGSYTLLGGSEYPALLEDGDWLSLRMEGTKVYACYNDCVVRTVTTSFNQAATDHGIRASDSAVRLDDFRVLSLG